MRGSSSAAPAARNFDQVVVMRVYVLGIGLLGLLAGCSADWDKGSRHRAQFAQLPKTNVAVGLVPTAGSQARTSAGIATLPDRGELVVYDKAKGRIQRGAYTWHPVQLSEEHALRAIAAGELVVTAPNGQPIRLKYERHIEHPDGNWTWIGRVPGTKPGVEAILTFGEKAVFGTIPYGEEEPLRLTTASGRVWLMETDRTAIARLDNAATRPRKPDYRLPPKFDRAATSGTQSVGAAQTQAATATAANTVDVLIGYTNGFATRLGGQSQAVTRLTYLVDVTNQAYVNSQVDAQVRLVRTMQVSYPDATNNETALYELSGVQCTTEPDSSLNCTYIGPPASLAPLYAARDQYGADLVSLVRNFNEPENEGCGIAWLIGGGQTNIDSSAADAGMSVVSDSNGTGGAGSFPDNGRVCRDETLAHELGHNMGEAHDVDTADGDDNVLQPNEYGRYVYSFGYKTGAGTGNFYTVMAYGESGQFGYRVFSNPNITYCGGYACGVANQADDARSLRLTIPIIATFRPTAAPPVARIRNDINKDSRSDLLWHSPSTNRFAYWLMNGATLLSYSPATTLASGYVPIATGDFNNDGYGDMVWSNNTTLSMRLAGANGAATWQIVGSSHPAGWKSAGSVDINGDGRSDLLWHNPSTNQFAYWLMNGATLVSYSSATTLASGYAPIATGDFNNDGYGDMVWSNNTTLSMRLAGANGAATWQVVGSHPAGWKSAGAIDINADGRSDLLWHNPSTNRFAYWLMNGSTLLSYSPALAVATGYLPMATGDFNNDGYGDMVWSNNTTLVMRLAAANGAATWPTVGSHPAGWKLIP